MDNCFADDGNTIGYFFRDVISPHCAGHFAHQRVIDFASADNFIWVSWCGTSSGAAQPLKIMGIVDISLYSSRFPTKSSVAHCTKHLVASRRFVNVDSAGRARLGVEFEKLDTFHGFGIAYMRFDFLAG